MQNRRKAEKYEFEKNYPDFSITDKIEIFKEVFNVSINLYKYSFDEKKYSKLHYYEKQDSQYLLNITLVPVKNGEHTIWLKEVDNALQFNVCFIITLSINAMKHIVMEVNIRKSLLLLPLNVKLILTMILIT
jgi:hypothetical protein